MMKRFILHILNIQKNSVFKCLSTKIGETFSIRYLSMENNKKQKLFSALWNLTTTESLHTEEITVDTRLYIVHKNCLIQYHINRIFADASCPPFEPFKCRGETKCISIQVTFPEECSKQWLTQLRFYAISKHIYVYIYTHIHISSVPV